MIEAELATLAGATCPKVVAAISACSPSVKAADAIIIAMYRLFIMEFYSFAEWIGLVRAAYSLAGRYRIKRLNQEGLLVGGAGCVAVAVAAGPTFAMVGFMN